MSVFLAEITSEEVHARMQEREMYPVATLCSLINERLATLDAMLVDMFGSPEEYAKIKQDMLDLGNPRMHLQGEVPQHISPETVTRTPTVGTDDAIRWADQERKRFDLSDAGE